MGNTCCHCLKSGSEEPAQSREQKDAKIENSYSNPRSPRASSIPQLVKGMQDEIDDDDFEPVKKTKSLAQNIPIGVNLSQSIDSHQGNLLNLLESSANEPPFLDEQEDVLKTSILKS